MADAVVLNDEVVGSIPTSSTKSHVSSGKSKGRAANATLPDYVPINVEAHGVRYAVRLVASLVALKIRFAAQSDPGRDTTCVIPPGRTRTGAR